EEAASSTSLITRGAISFSYLLESGRPGPSVLILGSVHGHEPCGASAIARMLQEFSRGELKLESGSLTLAIGNPEALARGVRGVDHNLNRLFHEDVACEPNSIEHRRVQELLPLFDGKSHVLDLHATSAPTEPFL